jgi:hypothetical protein
MTQRFLLISGNAPVLYPADTFFALLYYDKENAFEVPKCYPYSGTWGQVLSTSLPLQEVYSLPFRIDMVWLSIVERKFYSLEAALPVDRLKMLWQQTDEESGDALFEHIVVGMAPYGGLAVWTHGEKKSVLVVWLQAEEIEVEMEDFMPLNPTVSLDENCDFYINNDSRVKENLEQNGLPQRHLFDNYMKQFTYRYLPLFEHWDTDKEKWQKYDGEKDMKTMPELDYIEEALFDGTHDKLHDGGLMNYHEAGKPKKLSVKWHIKKSEYTAYFWFEDEEIRKVFDRFYGAHPETKTDFMIRIDSEKNKYEIALYRYGLKVPQVISETAYQLIVFKNKFEYYRSENYDQPKGAWIW